MSPVFINHKGEQEWYPKKEEQNGSLNFNGHDSEKQRDGIINSVARMMEMETKGVVSEEDVSRCIDINAQRLGIGEENLKNKALDILAKEEETEVN